MDEKMGESKIISDVFFTTFSCHCCIVFIDEVALLCVPIYHDNLTKEREKKKKI